MIEKSYARYEAALHGLVRYGRKLRMDGAKWAEFGRVIMLAERLQDKYVTYKATGNLTPILKEIAHFEADPWQLNVTEDGLVPVRLGELLTEHKADLAHLVTLEAGKVTSEALGEVQEMIDI
ncbi:MAG: hypothetical protein ACK46X_20790, partial [Candidatus Sericytochromatia bacterium]